MDCAFKRAISFIYETPITKKQSTREGFAQRLYFRNDKIYLDIKDFLSKKTITFNVQGGEAIEAISVMKNTAIGELPTPIKDFYVFDGWYTSLDFTISVNENTIPTGYNIYYAKWIPSVELAELNKNAYTIFVPYGIETVHSWSMSEAPNTKSIVVPSVTEEKSPSNSFT